MQAITRLGLLAGLLLLLGCGSSGENPAAAQDASSSDSSDAGTDGLPADAAQEDAGAEADAPPEVQVEAASEAEVEAEAEAEAEASLPVGTLTVQDNGHLPSTIVIGGSGAWVSFGRYRATASGEDILIDRIRLASLAGGDPADFESVGIASGGNVVASAVMVGGPDGAADVDLSGNPLHVSTASALEFEVFGKVASVVSSAAAAGAWSGVPRSGHQPGLCPAQGYVGGVWDASYAQALNISASGLTSGQKTAVSPGLTCAPPNVLRKARPVLTKQQPASTVLANGQNSLFRFTITSDPSPDVMLKQLVFTVIRSGGVSLSAFRLMRGSTQLPPSLVSIVDAAGADLSTGAMSSTASHVVVSFTGEEWISNAGSLYELFASASGAITGSAVSTRLYQDSSTDVVTGWLVSGKPFGDFGTSGSIYSLDVADPYDATPGATGALLWSDGSEQPHLSTAGGSRDWTNGVMVADLTTSQTLTSL